MTPKERVLRSNPKAFTSRFKRHGKSDWWDLWSDPRERHRMAHEPTPAKAWHAAAVLFGLMPKRRR